MGMENDTSMAPSTSAAAAKPTILLVEDDPAVRRSLQLIFHGNGFVVRSYGTVAASLADPNMSAIEGVIADYRLPDGDGIGLLGAMKTAGFRGHAILITAFGTPDLEARARAAGFSRVLDKPLADRMLRETMSGLLG